MRYSHDDAGLLRQPIGYWSWAASTSVVGHIRSRLATVALTQPQWWVISQLAEHRTGRPRSAVTTMLRGYLDAGDSIDAGIDDLVERGLVAERDGQLTLTPDGTSKLDEATDLQKQTMATIHDGVSDEDYLTTLKVLQRMIANTDGKFWHH